MNRCLSRRRFSAWALSAACALGMVGTAQAVEEPADVFIKRVSGDILEAIKADKSIHSGDVNKIVVLVDQRVMPNVNFLRMTASAVGPGWRQATPEQQKRLQEEFKALLVRTYAGALGQVNDQTIVVKPLRAAADDKEVLVRTEVRGKGDPIQLDYRVEKTADGAGWRVYNLNVMGIWLVENYRSQFAQEINAKGVDGLIASLADRNKTNARTSK
ncbi:ABC transporter substrate-binding protein [Limnohabitans sp.]|jgi:phospholipid transport system substrate-binding protein|uniref:MlaC/ttg2D family ABC transporter substrate-binding protein n=1 Tax=Limnohabitans sp. TaxID=1907725 RepID=UPI00286F4E9C|nr:ABC transporter substrate-binding protein [Limnohabitans sp.]